MKKYIVSTFALSILTTVIFSGCSSSNSQSDSLPNEMVPSSSLAGSSSSVDIENQTSADFFTIPSLDIFTLSYGDVYKGLTLTDYNYQEPDEETGIDILSTDFTGDIELQGRLLLQSDGALFLPDDEYMDIFPMPEIFLESYKEGTGPTFALDTYLNDSQILALTKSDNVKNQIEKAVLIFNEDPNSREYINCTIRIDKYLIRYTPVSGVRSAINIIDIKD